VTCVVGSSLMSCAGEGAGALESLALGMRIVGRSLTEGASGVGSGAAETRTVGRSLTAELGATTGFAAGVETGAMLFFPFAPMAALAPSLAP
jgi:hypothetical protein